MNAELTIVIPAKNEVEMLPRLLESLCRQDYPLMRSTKIFLADAGSTDGTPELALSFAGRLDIEVIPGGLPSVGRNAGARRAESAYVLFIDADMELKDTTLVRRTMELAGRRKLHCATTNIWCSQGGLRDQVLYIANNIAQYGSFLVRPFSTGMFMLFEKKTFDRLGRDQVNDTMCYGVSLLGVKNEKVGHSILSVHVASMGADSKSFSRTCNGECR